jgi:hypothetical protein
LYHCLNISTYRFENLNEDELVVTYTEKKNC